MERRRHAGRNGLPLAGGFHRFGGRFVVCRWNGGSRSSLRGRWWKKNDSEEPEDHALGRSRGGFSTKIHLLCNGDGYPLHFHLTPGQAHESTALEPLLAGADEQVLDEDRQPVAWPVALAGDKGYRAEWIDEYLLALGIQPVIPSKENEARDARPVEFDKDAYRQRNIVERLIGWLKESRRIFSRYEKTAKNFGGMLKMAFVQLYLRWGT
jgi:transposase